MRLLAACGAVVLVIAVAVALLISASGSAGGVKVPQFQPALAASGSAPTPPHGALVLARGHGDLAVALAARRQGGEVQLTATVIAADGTGLRGLSLRFRPMAPACPRPGRAVRAATPRRRPCARP